MTAAKMAGTKILKKLLRPRQSKYVLRLYVSRWTTRSRVAVSPAFSETAYGS